MDAGLQGMLAHLEETWNGLLKAVEGAGDDVFYWTPGPEFNSVAILLRHLAGSERWWIGEAIGGVPSHRVRDAEFAHDRPRREDVLRAVEEARRITRQVLGAVTMQDLHAETTPTVTWGKPPRRPTKLWALLHYLDHLGYHRGQALLLLKLARATPREARAR
ncbi:MAG TPA: DinB family protein [bacterium]|nr:DinB family protein [bacterium]